MDFAADAVLDVVAPQARQAPARAPSAASDEPTFEDHLQAATQESEAAQEPEVLPGPEQPPVEAALEAFDPIHSLLGGEIMPVAPPAQPALDQTSAPVLLHLITSMLSPAQPDSAKPQTITPTAPTLPPPDASAPSMAPIAPSAVDAQNAPVAAGNAGTAAPSFDKSATPAEKSVIPTQTAQTAPAPTTQTAQAMPIPVFATAPSAPSTEAQALPAAIAAVQAQPAPEHARQAKAPPAQGEAKFDGAPVQDRTAMSPLAAPPRGNAKTAAPQTLAKNAAAFAPLDAPEAAPAQPTSSATPAAAASTHVQHAVAEESAARAAPAAQQVAREIVRRFEGGNTRFELRLDPPELGRVEVKLEVSRDHRVTAVIAADSPQALTELARHARELEQMLQGAGLELTDNGLSFDLRQGGEQEAGERGATRSGGEANALSEEPAPVAARPIGYERWRGVRVDMMV